VVREFSTADGPAEPEGTTVPPERVTEVMSRQSGLPPALISDDVRLTAEDVHAYFAERVVGQDVAVEAVVNLVRMIKAELQDPGRPMGVFLFVGPTGSGKTLLAKTLAEYLFGAEEQLTRFDMSEYVLPQSADELAQRIVDQVRQKRFVVLLLDEVEKANPLVYDLFLQAFSDGILRDSFGRTATLLSAIVIMRSIL